MFEKISKQHVLAFLRSVAVMSIAANGDHGRPVSSVVVFAVDNDLSFYFLTKRETYKAKALEKNPKISLSVWENNKMLVQATGSATEVDAHDFNKIHLKINNASKVLKNFWWPILNIDKGEFVIFKIHPDWLRVLDLTGRHIKEEGDPFFDIDL